MEKKMNENNGNCTECCYNGGDVCLGYGVLPDSSDDYIGSTYSLPISYLQSVFSDTDKSCCTAFKFKESK